jgi:hypothetical protein
MRALIAELRAELTQAVSAPEAPVSQEGVWKGIKKVASKVADVADTAVSAIPVVGTAYDAGVGVYKAAKTVQHGTKALGQWATGNKKGAAQSLQKAKSAGVDTLGRAAGAAAGFVAPGVGGLAAKVIGKPIIKAAVGTAFKSGAKSIIKAGTTAAHTAIDKPTAPPLVKKKKPPVVGGAPVATTGESVVFQSNRALVEFRSLAGLPITKKHQALLETEELELDAVR